MSGVEPGRCLLLSVRDFNTYDPFCDNGGRLIDSLSHNDFLLIIFIKYEINVLHQDFMHLRDGSLHRLLNTAIFV